MQSRRINIKQHFRMISEVWAGTQALNSCKSRPSWSCPLTFCFSVILEMNVFSFLLHLQNAAYTVGIKENLGLSLTSYSGKCVIWSICVSVSFFFLFIHLLSGRHEEISWPWCKCRVETHVLHVDGNAVSSTQWEQQ